jgi:cytochrome oxidase assembly protein ShyY1
MDKKTKIFSRVRFSDLLGEGFMEFIIFVALLVSLSLNVVVAIGNWNLYRRVERVETILGIRAMPQSPQTALPSRPR